MNTEILQCREKDISVIEVILADAENRVSKKGMSLWSADRIKWESLSKTFKPEDFYIIYADTLPAGCMALVDYDPVFWPDIQKGEALFIHKLAVKSQYIGKRISNELIDFAKKKAYESGIKTVRLDCHQHRDRLRAFYEAQGFECVCEKNIFGIYTTAFYIYKIKNLP